MNKQETITSKEALGIYEKNTLTVAEAMDNIHRAATQGVRQVNIPKDMSPEVAIEIMNLGYKIGKLTDPFGLVVNTISF